MLLVGLVVGLLTMHSARAADPKGNAGDNGKSQNVDKQNAPKGNGADKPKDGNGNDTGNGNGSANGNGNGGNSGTPSDSGKNSSDSSLKSEFKAQAEALQKKQKDLVDQLKKANADERAKIREQLVILKENWKEINREYRDKLDDLKDKADREGSSGSSGSRAGGRPRN